MKTIEPDLSAHVRRLSAEIGTRPIGSPANQTAADYIREFFLDAGLEVEEQPYACTAWEHVQTRLTLDGVSLPASANAFSLPCDVTSLLIPACTVEELEQAEIKGKIVLFYGDLAKAPVSPKSWFLLGERDRHVIELLEHKRPAALLAPPAATTEYSQVTEDWELDLPAATIPTETALTLLRRVESRLHLQIQAQRVPATARNIVARKPGRGPGKVVLMAHFDTKIGTPGALDNAAGAAVLLGLARSLASTDLPFGLEFVAFNGEEYLPIGDDEYLRRGEGDFPNILAAVNFDGLGAVLGANSLTAISASADFETQAKSLAGDHPAFVWVEPWPESNHSTFSFRGVPALAFSSVGTRSLAHSPADTPDQVSEEKLRDATLLATEIVSSLQGKPIGWGRVES